MESILPHSQPHKLERPQPQILPWLELFAAHQIGKCPRMLAEAGADIDLIERNPVHSDLTDPHVASEKNNNREQANI